MNYKELLLSNIERIHTTSMGIDRIKKNLNINVDDVVFYCKNKIQDKNCKIYKKGKNYYCEIDNIIITKQILTDLFFYVIINKEIFRRL